MRVQPIAIARPQPSVCAGLLGFASAAVWANAMATRQLSEVAFGPICGARHAIWALHCPSCYVAAALALLAAVVSLGAKSARRSG